MTRIQATNSEIEQQPVNPLTHSATQMEKTPYRSELTNLTDQPLDFYEKEYIDFIDLAAHELDAPLRKLSLLTGRLTDKFEAIPHDKDMHTYIDRINSCVQDMQSVIDNLTILAKVASDKTEYIACNLEEVVQKVMDGLAASIKASKAVIHISSLPVVAGDAAQFSRLFKNLFENALKFSRENVVSEITIRSSMLSSEEKEQYKLPGNKVYHRIEISDNGIGFKNEYAEKIFRPFVRLHGKSKFSGTGMGLAICKKIAENHHGIIYANSSEKEGSRFVLLLPQIL